MPNYALPAKSKYFTGKLYGRMNDDLHLAGMSQRTVHGYLRSVRQLADFCQTTPDTITEAQLRRFFLHLKNERHFAWRNDANRPGVPRTVQRFAPTLDRVPG